MSAGTQERAVRLGGRILLGVLLGAARPGAPDRPVEQDMSGERARVVRAGALAEVLGRARSLGRGELLEGRLPVQAGAQTGGDGEGWVHQTLDDRPGRLQAAVSYTHLTLPT